MRKVTGLLLLLVSMRAASQDSASAATNTIKPEAKPERDYVWTFASPKLINANTVEMTPKHVLEFKVTHNFGDIGGDNGGSKTAFGLDNATDVRIGFQYGINDNFNVILARAKGASTVRQLYELGLKYRFMRQTTDGSRPLSIALFANNVISAMEASPVPNQDNSFEKFTDRFSQTVQLIIARKFKPFSLQLNPTLVHTNYVVPNDDNTIFSLGAALRIPVKGKFSLLFDYFHSFRSQHSIDYYKAQGVKFYDAIGVGLEILTAGHVFHLNFTNATEILENRFVPHTVSSWGKGQFRWGFNISRDFNLFYKKGRK